MTPRKYTQQDRQTLKPIQPKPDDWAASKEPEPLPGWRVQHTERDKLIIREVAIKEAANAALQLILADKVVSHKDLQPYQVLVNLTAVLTEHFAEIIQGEYKPDAISGGTMELQYPAPQQANSKLRVAKE